MLRSCCDSGYPNHHSNSIINLILKKYLKRDKNNNNNKNNIIKTNKTNYTQCKWG